MDALRVARERAAERRASIKLRETPEWLSGSKSGEAGVAARERLPGPFGGGKRKAPPKKKEKSETELRAAAEEAQREEDEAQRRAEQEAAKPAAPKVSEMVRKAPIKKAMSSVSSCASRAAQKQKSIFGLIDSPAPSTSTTAAGSWSDGANAPPGRGGSLTSHQLEL